MAQVLAGRLDVCADCALIIANDDDSGIEDPAAHRARMAAEWAEWIESFKDQGLTPARLVTAGFVIGDETDDFSSRACDSCGTRDAGARLGASIIG